MRGVRKPVAGAFGKRRDSYVDDELEEAKRAVRDAIAIQYTYDEIREFSEQRQREMERLREIEDMFGELAGGGPDALEDAHYRVHQYRVGRRRVRHGKVRMLRPVDAALVRQRARERYLRWRAKHPRPMQAKLTTALAVEIRELYQRGLFQTDLATVYGVSLSTVSLLVKGKTWKRAGGPIVARALRTHRRLPVVRDAAKVEARLERQRKRKRTRYAADPESFRQAERDRRKRNLDTIRKRDRERYAARAAVIANQHRERLARKSDAELARIAARLGAANRRYYAKHKAKVLQKQAGKKGAKQAYDRARYAAGHRRAA